MALKEGICTAMTPALLSKLHHSGVVSVVDFLSRDPETLANEVHVSYKDICSIRRVLLAENSAHPVSALVLYQNAMSSLTIVSSGCQAIDTFLDGGLYTGELTELAGDTCTGKSRLCHWSAASTVKSGDHSVLYIDTCGSFNVRTLLETFSDETTDESTLEKRLKSVRRLQVFDMFELFAALDNISAALNDSDCNAWSNLKLVVVDNLAMLVYPSQSSHTAYSQGLVSRLGIKLKRLADTFSVAVLVTNNLVNVYGSQQSCGVEQRKPALGKVWSHTPHTRVLLHRVGPNMSAQVEAHLVKSQRQQTPSKTTFSLVRPRKETADDRPS